MPLRKPTNACAARIGYAELAGSVFSDEGVCLANKSTFFQAIASW